jgi:hypothetical protein
MLGPRSSRAAGQADRKTRPIGFRAAVLNCSAATETREGLTTERRRRAFPRGCAGGVVVSHSRMAASAGTETT